MKDLYQIVEQEYLKYEEGTKSLFTEDLLRELCLGLNSMCLGAESKYFNGKTNITDDKFIVFGVKGLMDSNKKLKDAMLFNILSYMNHKLLTTGNTAASIDELYLFLTNLTAIEYIRNASKRVRKKESSIILASQNIEDFLLPEVKELTKPLFSIPTHQFLFNAGMYTQTKGCYNTASGGNYAIVGDSRTDGSYYFASNYWSSSHSAAKGTGSQGITDNTGCTKIENTAAAWATAATAMNAELESYDYRYVVNTDTATSSTEPLIIEKITE